MTPSSVLLLLLQLCSLQLMLVAMPTCHLQGTLVQEAHNLLRDLGTPFPVHCLPYNANISFPSSVFPAATANHPQCRRALWVVYESLDKAGPIFNDEDHVPPVGKGGVNWDVKKLDDFKNVQDRLQEQGSCLSDVDTSGVLSPYFGNVTAVIEQENAACGWQALRRDLLWVLKSALQNHHKCFTWSHAH
ncbi:interferon phi 3 [Thunnus albacares]|uniref:interferon phi 3 n=1 Tax=Thunnus albacares TaxID=8236 RepID=UPI001CF646FF|nr:interferon phi 3 [Thunnus albacares]